MEGVVYIFFFFSSRRRHTRLQGDWSSDVCSSDLDLHRPESAGPEVGPEVGAIVAAELHGYEGGGDRVSCVAETVSRGHVVRANHNAHRSPPGPSVRRAPASIGT